jgi:hypothetical protein
MYRAYKKLTEQKEKYDYHCLMVNILDVLTEKDSSLNSYYNVRWQIKREDVYFKKEPKDLVGLVGGLSMNLEICPKKAVFSHTDGYELPLEFKV